MPRSPDTTLSKLPTCDSCGLELSDANALEIHAEACFPRPQGGYVVCQKSGCGYRTKTAPNLRNHVIAMHTKSKLYECSLCDFKSTWQTSLCGHNRKMHGLQTPKDRKRRPQTQPEAIGDTPKRLRLGALNRRSRVGSVDCSPESVVSTDAASEVACEWTLTQHSGYVVCKICDYVLESESSLESHQKYCRSDVIDFASDSTRSSSSDKEDISLVEIDIGGDEGSIFHGLRFAINLSVML